MKNLLFAVGLALIACIASAGEKGVGSGHPGTHIIVPSALTVTGSLNGAPVYNSAYTAGGSTYDGSCSLANTLSGIGVDVAYAVIPFHTTNPAGEVLIVSSDNPGTNIVDTTLSIYCAFNPNDATTGLFAYNDDFGSAFLSGFDSSEGVMLAPNTTYYAVLSLYSPTEIGGGSYELRFGGDVVAGAYAVQPVPTLSLRSLMLLALLVLVFGAVLLRRWQRHN